MSAVNHYFGIDFGTTNSAVVVIEEINGLRRSINLGDEFGGPFPSLVAIDRITGEVFSGREVWMERRELSESCEIINSVKSVLGSNKTWIIAGQTWTPMDIVSSLFRKLVKNSYDKISIAINEAIISIPVGFSSIKRRELRKAATMAGLKVKGFINESTSAYISNHNALKKFSKVAIFDWGGGTLDVSVIEVIKNNIFELGLKGLAYGGDDIDLKIALWAHQQIINKHNIETLFSDVDSVSQDALLIEAEKAKRNLQTDNITSIILYEYYGLKGVIIPLTIEVFEDLINHDVNNALNTLEATVRESSLSMSQIDAILMVGGSSNLTLLQDRIYSKWDNKAIIYPDDPEWSIARGAAYINFNSGETKLNQDIGILLSNNYFHPIFKRGTSIPTKIIQNDFGTVDNSDEARFIFTDNVLDNNSTPRIIDVVNIQIYGFQNEVINMNSYIDADMIFNTEIKSNHKPTSYIEDCIIPELRYFYELPKGMGDE